MGGWLGRSLDTVPSAEDEDFQGSDSNDNLLSGDPLGTSPDQPLSSESIEVIATTDMATPELLLEICSPACFSSFSFCSPSISVEEFLERQVKAIVSREGCEQIVLFPKCNLLAVRTPLLLLASLGLTVRRNLEGQETKQERLRRRRQINWLCLV